SLRQEFLSDPSTQKLSFTSSASRLLAAAQDEYHSLESELSILYNGRVALLFNSGYHANTGILSALASENGTLIIADKLVHASIIDGIILSKAPWQRFVHNDMNRLENILKKEHERYDRIIIVVESVYSMDGDRADLNQLIALKRRYPKAMLYVDEAHAVGVLGPKGTGACMDTDAFEEIDVIVGTFGKALASVGAYCITDSYIHDYLINRSRSLIFSTALPPICCSWTRKMLHLSSTMTEERRHLASLSRRLADGLTDLGCEANPSHIMPYITHSATLATDISQKLFADGFKVLPIRTPTVPPGTERLRISLSAALTTDDIDRFIASLNKAINE
ncbi:MAG: 8-amino-7-oxononanoate synthase, partial [Prevotella sp.]|nr:8-amino-7-oxononanoate synthase [Prevotella sp.]